MKILRYTFLLLFIFLYSCENEPVEKADPSRVIAVDSELYDLIQRVAAKDFENELTCINFNYAFTLIVYDEDMNEILHQPIRSDSEFSDFLASLEPGKSISLSYPITSILLDGQPFQINSNEELKAAIDQCLEADTILTYNTLLTQTSCIWKVSHLEGPNGQYEDSKFQVSPSGNVGLHFQDQSFGGTWISYFIENKLHLNIFISGDEEVSAVWNFDWKVISYNESKMEIDNGVNRFLLTRSCFESCRSFLFEECETEPGSGMAVFDLESYFECFFPFSRILDITTVTWNYYESMEEMEAGTNPITNLPFTNSLNPQIIYVRFDDVNTGEMVTFLPIILKAIKC